MTKLFFPSLSESGWITDSRQIGDYLFAHFFASNYSQTQIYIGQVSSMAYIIATNADDIDKTVSTLQQQLQTYFGRYFSTVTVEIRYFENPEDANKVDLTIYIGYTDSEGNEFTIGRLLSELDSQTYKITKLINTGSL
jgi:hypothetical protein